MSGFFLIFFSPITLKVTSEKVCLFVVFYVSFTVQELCESRGGRSGLSVLTSLMVSVDVKLY